MKLLLIQNIQESKRNILLAASATKGMGYGLEEQTILWVCDIYVGTDSLRSSLAYMPCESSAAMAVPRTMVQARLGNKNFGTFH